ncbi:MAG: aminoglycoside phosphotransferase family protein [Candidatus Bathyarchaeota archaeon]|nr:aminoglycoside phosphotransferase family protein [Candidatus Bathyarchaeota archaeon]
MESKVKGYLENLDPKILGLGKMESVEVERLGLGESNLNYLAIIDGEKFTVRINMYPAFPEKSRKEYDSLKLVEPLDIAPKAFHFEPSKEFLGETFIILEYLEGKSLNECGKINDATVKELGRIVARLHSTNIEAIKKHLRKSRSSKKGMLNSIRGRIDHIKTKRNPYFKEKGAFEKVLASSFRKLQGMKFSGIPCEVLGHGDMDPQNVISSGEKLRMIDWEDLGRVDPAWEIASIFDAFDFSDSQKELFLNAYSQIRKDPELRKRIQSFWPLQLFGVFCWAIMHVYEIGEGEIHESFLKEQDLKEHIDYAHKMFRKCKNEKIIDENAEWNVAEIFPEKFLT